LNEVTFMLAIAFFLMTTAITSRPFYQFSMKRYTKRVPSKFGFKVSELNYSYDQMIYFISLPTTLPNVKSAKKNDLIIEHDYSSFFYPLLKGVKISIVTNGEKVYLAYLPVGNFWIPQLDKLKQEGKIDEQTYLKISTSKLLHPKTMKEVREEVYKHLQVGRY
jgi:hypothetical protein